ncbi:MAG: hypothetical protein HC781_19610 [Leptolyngbyaceae cyanobacterium CSU_1_4]|nr:hypothetical protein [Leptolyngbyaceae cyanobacterium CSU_1_4]
MDEQILLRTNDPPLVLQFILLISSGSSHGFRPSLTRKASKTVLCTYPACPNQRLRPREDGKCTFTRVFEGDLRCRVKLLLMDLQIHIALPQVTVGLTRFLYVTLQIGGKLSIKRIVYMHFIDTLWILLRSVGSMGSCNFELRFMLLAVEPTEVN